MTQREIQEFLSRSVQRGQIAHAVLLEGDSGEDWKSLAEEYAVTLQCDRKCHCGFCRACQAWERNAHPDIIRVTHEKPEVITVDEIRHQLVDDMAIRPYWGPYKVYLLDEAEKMNVQAQNALLKTLEEPPSYGVIVLMTANAEKLLPTIRSRCILLKTQSLTPGQVSLEEEDRQFLLSLLHGAGEMEISRMAERAKELKERKIPTSPLMDFFRLWYRDLLVWKSTGDAKRLLLPEEQPYYQEMAGMYSYRRLDQIFAAVDEAEMRIRSNVNFELAVECMLMAMNYQ